MMLKGMHIAPNFHVLRMSIHPADYPLYFVLLGSQPFPFMDNSVRVNA